MANRINGDPKVTQCIIVIQEHFKHDKVLQWDAYSTQTAVKKYFIGIGDRGATLLDFTLDRKNFLTYPWIKVNEKGVKFVRCPTISGISGKFNHV